MPGKWKKSDWLLLAFFLLGLILAFFLKNDFWTMLALVLGIILFIRIFVLMNRRLLWKIRNRLIVASIFFTVTPILLMAVLFYLISSFLISQYNSLIFENIMQRNLSSMERVADIQLRSKERGTVAPEIERITRRQPPPRFLKMALYAKRDQGWEMFFKFPEGFPGERIDVQFVTSHFQSGFFRMEGELHFGIFKVKNGMAAFVFDTVSQDYFDLLPRIGDFKVMFQPISRGSIVNESRKMTRRLDSKEFEGFESYRLPFPYDFRYLDFDVGEGAKPQQRTHWFIIINDYSKLWQRLMGRDPSWPLRREIQALQIELVGLAAGPEKEAKTWRLSELQRELEMTARTRSKGSTSLIPLISKIFVGLFAFFIICSIFIGFRIIRVITRSVNQLTKGMERIRNGDFSYRIQIKSNDQMRYLADSFNEMASGMGRLLNEETERHRMEEELRIARTIQLKLLPQDVFSTEQFEIAAVNIPAREIAGDYFDYFYQQGKHLTVLVADVSGKGAPAAFYMAELKGVMNLLQAQDYSPAEMIGQCHRSLLPSFDKVTFITMNLVRFDLARRSLVFARSGHTPAIFYDSRSRTCRELTPAGPAIGLTQFSRESIEQIEMTFQSGDILFFFSDGLSEVMNTQGEVLGLAGLKKLLCANAALPAVHIRQSILDYSIAFSQSNPNQDDLTFVVIKIA